MMYVDKCWDGQVLPTRNGVSQQRVAAFFFDETTKVLYNSASW